MGTMGRPMPRNSSGVRHSWREGEEKKGKEKKNKERKGRIKERGKSKTEEPVRKRARVLWKLQKESTFNSIRSSATWQFSDLCGLRHGLADLRLCPFLKSLPHLII